MQVQLSINGEAQEIEMAEGTTVTEALNSQGINAQDLEVLVNGQVSRNEQVLNDNDTVFVQTAETVENAITVATPVATTVVATPVGEINFK